MTTIEWIIIFIIGLFVHELGHWIAYHIMGYKAKLGFKLPFMMYVGENIQNDVKIGHTTVILYSGVLLGWFFFELFEPSRILIFTYLLMSSADLNKIIMFMQANKKEREMTLRQWLIQEYKRLSEN